jgi:hypothetical protein
MQMRKWVFYAAFLKYVFPFDWRTRMQSSSMAFLISSSVVQTTGIHVVCSSRVMYLIVARMSLGLCPKVDRSMAASVSVTSTTEPIRGSCIVEQGKDSLDNNDSDYSIVDRLFLRPFEDTHSSYSFDTERIVA